MVKRRGKYDKSGMTEWTNQDRADHYLELLNKEMAQSPNLAAIIHSLRAEKPALQQMVVRRWLPPKAGKPGRPKRTLPDRNVLETVEVGKEELAKTRKGKITDRAAAVFVLEQGWLQLGRQEGVPFKLRTNAGKREMARVIAAVVRARKALKSKIPPA